MRPNEHDWQHVRERWSEALAALDPAADVRFVSGTPCLVVHTAGRPDLEVDLSIHLGVGATEAAIEAHAAEAHRLSRPLTEPGELEALLVPWVVDQGEVKRALPSTLGEWPVGGTLQLLHAVEQLGVRRPLDPAELRRVPRRPRRRALQNLLKSVGDPVYEQVDGIWQVRLDGRHEGSLLLLGGLWDRLEADIGGTVVLAHPEAGVLWSCAEHDEAGVAALRQSIAAAIADPSRVGGCNQLLRWTEKSWQTVDPMRRCPVCSWSAPPSASRCPSCGSPHDEHRFLAWSVAALVIGLVVLWAANRMGAPLPAWWGWEVLATAAVAWPVGYLLSALRARRAEPWRPLLADAEANLLDRSIRTPLVPALAVAVALLPTLASGLLAPPDLPPVMTALWSIRQLLLIAVVVALPSVLTWRHGWRWLDPRPQSTLDPS